MRHPWREWWLHIRPTFTPGFLAMRISASGVYMGVVVVETILVQTGHLLRSPYNRQPIPLWAETLWTADWIMPRHLRSPMM